MKISKVVIVINRTNPHLIGVTARIGQRRLNSYRCICRPKTYIDSPSSTT